VTLVLTLPNPKRLLSGYLMGAAATSVTCGLLLVLLLRGSSTSSTSKHTVNPIIDLTLGVLILLIVAGVARRRDRRRRVARAQTRGTQAAAALEARTEQGVGPGHVHRRRVVELPRCLVHRRDGRAEQAAPLDHRDADRPCSCST
jgi:hypothetical protein